LRYIPWLAHRFKRPAGYLGREHGIGWTFVAVALGAIVIERPFTLDPSLPGAGHSASIGPDELRRVARGLADLSQALQPVGERRVFREELGALEASGRALVARRALRAGRVLRASDVSAGPSAAGLSVRLGRWVTGKRLRYDLEAGEPITFGILDSE
jgi:N-acetylneuraminate synthase